MKKIKSHCRECKRKTNHLVHTKYEPTPYENEEFEGIMHYDEYLIIECLGCDNISFLNIYWDSTDIDEDGNITKGQFQFPEDPDLYGYYNFLNEDDHSELPNMLYDLYGELKKTLQNEVDTLGGVGLRMVVEAVCLHQKITGRTLKDKILKLYDTGIISKNDFEIIDRLREIGNISAHKIKSPSSTDLEAALEAINHLLRTVYIVQKRTKSLRKKKLEQN